ncbi:hypothetical protein [Cellulomonas soli]
MTDGDEHAGRLAASLRDTLVESLTAPAPHLSAAAWPTLHAAVVCSAPGGDDPDRLLLAVEARLRRRKAAGRRDVPDPRAPALPV